MICVGGMVGIATGLFIALQLTSTEHGTEKFRMYSEQLLNMTDNIPTMWNTPLIFLPGANSRALPPADPNWVKKVETLQALRGQADMLKQEEYGVVIPAETQEKKKSCVPLVEQPTEFMFHAQD